MNITELRFGNIVNKGIVHSIGYKEGILGCAVIENKFMSFGTWYTYMDVEPEPLTDDVLLRFGFGRNMTGTAWWNDKKEDFLIGEQDGKFYYSEWDWTFDNEPTLDHKFELKHVHRLQNLFFEMSNEELQEE